MIIRSAAVLHASALRKYARQDVHMFPAAPHDKNEGVGQLALDGFPAHLVWQQERLPEFFSRCILAMRLRSCSAPVLVTGSTARRAYSRLLVPIDFGMSSREAARIAARLAPGKQLTFLHAYRVPESETYARPGSVASAGARRVFAQEEARWHLNEFVDALRMECGMVSRVVHYGRAEHVVTEYASRMHADLIVLGVPAGHLVTSFQSVSHAARLLARTSADVLLVPLGAAAGLSPQGRPESGAIRRPRPAD